MPGVADYIKKGVDAKAKRWSIIIYSYPGAGKTTFAAQAPRPLILELDENGWIVLRNPLVAENVSYIAFRDFKKFVQFIRALAKDKDSLDSYDTLVIDTVSELQTLERLSQLPGDLVLDDKWKFNENIYTKNNFRIMTILRDVFDLGKNMIINCHMKEETLTDGADKKVIVRPDLSPGLLSSIMAMVDGTFFLDKQNDTRRLYLQ